MIYSVLADAVVVVHVAFVVFVVVGGFLALRWRWLVWLHLPAAVWGVLIELVGWICPLTPLEIALRQKAGGSGYQGGFIENYILPLLYPAGFPPWIHYALGAGALVVNVVAYLLFFRGRAGAGSRA